MRDLLAGILFAAEPKSSLNQHKDCTRRKTAIAIAVAVWLPIYGEKQIESEKPFHATLKSDIWHVEGSLPKQFSLGGVADADISKDDGRIGANQSRPMITFLHGKLVEALPTQVVVDVNGIGYEALIPLSSFDKLPQPGGEVKLLTQLIVREDAHVLYGFATTAERDLFRLLIHSVSGIGPKTALNILSGISVTAFRGAVAGSDVKSLSQISGVGKKTAERIVVELRDKIGAAGVWEAASAKHALSPDDQKINDAVLALMALGFKQIEAHDAVRAAQTMLGAPATVEQLVRACLKKGS